MYSWVTSSPVSLTAPHGKTLAELDLPVFGHLPLLLLELALLHPGLLLWRRGVGSLAGRGLDHQLAPLTRSKGDVTMWRPKLA